VKVLLPNASVQLKSTLSQCLTNSANIAEDIDVHGICKLGKQGRATYMYSFYGTFSSEFDKIQKEYILRVFRGESVEKARKEFAILNALKEQELPVPIVYCFEENCELFGKPIMIMEKVNGDDASKYMNNEDAAKHIVKIMAKCLVDIHSANPWLIKTSDIMQEQYERKQKELLGIRFFIDKRCPSFFGFSPPIQRRFISAVKQLEYEEPKKVCPALLHLDYEPNHFLVSNGDCIVVDWGEANIGDPAYDVAWTYHKLRLERENAKVDLGEYFVKCYEEYSDKELANLCYFKDTVAIEMVKFCGLSPFRAKKYRDYVKFISILFGDIFGEVTRALHVQKLRKVMDGHHTPVWTNIHYIQSYALRYLERDRYKTVD
jgi:aminoglycoside phosphotransferase (APT) family kinase protein